MKKTKQIILFSLLIFALCVFVGCSNKNTKYDDNIENADNSETIIENSESNSEYEEITLYEDDTENDLEEIAEVEEGLSDSEDNCGVTELLIDDWICPLSNNEIIFFEDGTCKVFQEGDEIFAYYEIINGGNAINLTPVGNDVYLPTASDIVIEGDSLYLGEEWYYRNGIYPTFTKDYTHYVDKAIVGGIIPAELLLEQDSSLRLYDMNSDKDKAFVIQGMVKSLWCYMKGLTSFDQIYSFIKSYDEIYSDGSNLVFVGKVDAAEYEEMFLEYREDFPGAYEKIQKYIDDDGKIDIVCYVVVFGDGCKMDGHVLGEAAASEEGYEYVVSEEDYVAWYIPNDGRSVCCFALDGNY